MTESDILRIWNGPTSQCNRAKILQFAADLESRLRAEWSAGQEPVLYWHKESPDPDEWDVFDPAERCPRCTPLYLHPAPVAQECECPVEGHVTGCPNDMLTRFSAPVAKPAEKEIMMVPRELLVRAAKFMDAAIDEVDTDTIRGELRSAEIECHRLLAASKEKT